LEEVMVDGMAFSGGGFRGRGRQKGEGLVKIALIKQADYRKVYYKDESYSA
jgi:hypothetical protein